MSVNNKNDIAIIGMSGRFPKARNLDEFWDNLQAGIDCISEIPKERWELDNYYSQEAENDNKTYSRWGGFLEDAYDFDPAFFNISPREAVYMDPQHRKALETAYEAFENAGYGLDEIYNSDTGVFLGIMGRGFYDNLITNKSLLHGHMFTSSLLGFSANRISYHLNLKGPSISVDTLCSSSLVSVHLAIQSLLNGECTKALSGGVYIHFSPEHYILLSKMKVLSKDGHCKTFDESANGIVSGEGVGLILLKKMDQALNDGDNIHAVIKGSVVNNDGRSSRFTATSTEAQEELVTKALTMTRINPESITYFEAHGTGTFLGDPIELMALKKTYEKYTNRKAYCALGSVKSNIGHLESAAGIAGLIKVVLSMKHKQLPPTLHVKKVNHFIDLSDSPFVINDRLTSWLPESGLLRAGISSFGMGGTNAHIILEEASSINMTPEVNEKLPGIVVLSAKTKDSLVKIAESFRAYICSLAKEEFYNVCYTSCASKRYFAHRIAVICTDLKDLEIKLDQVLTAGLESQNISGDKISYNHCKNDKKSLVMVFEEAEASLVGFKALKDSGLFRDILDECSETFQEFSDTSILDYLVNTGKKDKKITDLVLIVTRYAFMKILARLGLKPDLVCYTGNAIRTGAAAFCAKNLKEVISDYSSNEVLQNEVAQSKYHNNGKIKLIDIERTAYVQKDGDITVNISNFIDSDLSDFLKNAVKLYSDGVGIKFEELYKGLGTCRIPLPAYPFDYRKYILEIAANKPSIKENASGEGLNNNPSGVFLGRELYRTPHKCVNELEIDRELETLFSHHKIMGQAVLPGVVYLEMAAEAAAQFSGLINCTISDLVVSSPLDVLYGKKATISTDREGNGFAFKVESLQENGQSITHASGRIVAASSYSGDEPDMETIAALQLNSLSIDDFYSYFEDSGVSYGKSFKILKEISVGNLSAYSYICCADSIGEKGGFFLQPNVVDGALQTVVSILYEAGVVNSRQPFLPFYFRRVKLFKPVIKECHCYVRLLSAPVRDAQTVKSDIYLFDGNRQLALIIEGFTLKRAFEKVYAALKERCYYKSVWVENPLSLSVVPNIAGSFLVFGSPDSFGNKLMEELKEKGMNPISVYPGADFEKIGINCFKINPKNIADYDLLLKTADNLYGDLRGIIHLWSYLRDESKSYSDDGEADFNKSLYSVFHTVKSLSVITIKKPFATLIVTGGKEDKRLAGCIEPEDSAIAGMVKVIRMEQPGIGARCLDCRGDHGADKLAAWIIDELRCGNNAGFVRYKECKRLVETITAITEYIPVDGFKLEQEGVYVITGGLGGIGLELAKYLGSKHHAKLIIISRQHPEDKPAKVKDALCSMAVLGIQVECYAVDVADCRNMNKIFKDLIKKYGKIDGVFHAAGTISDRLFKNKDFSALMEVLRPKVYGTKVLGEMLKDGQFKFLVLFSSITSVWGNIGQSDYAAANAYLDGYALAARRQGYNCMSISWSYWDVGMGSGLLQSARNRGYEPYATATALSTLEKALNLGEGHLILVNYYTNSSQPTVKHIKNIEKIRVDIKRTFQDYLMETVAKLLELPLEHIDLETSFQEFGVDSLLSVKLAEEIKEAMDIDVDGTLVFDYPDISQLSNYLLSSHQQKVEEFFAVQAEDMAEEEQNHSVKVKTDYNINVNDGTKNLPVNSNKKLTELMLKLLAETLEIPADQLGEDMSFTEMGTDSILAVSYTKKLSEKLGISLESTLIFDYPNINCLQDYLIKEHIERIYTCLGESSTSFKLLPEQETLPVNCQVKDLRVSDLQRDVAIIGMAGRFPGARNISEFWGNIFSGISVTGNFPINRIDMKLDVYKSQEYSEIKDRLYGGYIDDIDCFDSLFFEISPREAELMDPQQRILLETVWHAFENAGYTQKQLSGTRTGVYIGTCITEYAKFIDNLDAMAGTGNEISITSNRISYIFNLKGPSLTIDTACSSSLVALDTAYNSIVSGSCDMAVAGGVNLILTPWFSIAFDKAGMLSKDGSCKTFDESANGYVRGEGAGVVILKPLIKALQDKDNILAVIKGSAVNQDGHTNGLTAPNALAQEEVILQAWEKAGVHPRTISLVEAHGTGTSLGDPIEIKGLTKAFRKYTEDIGFCAIGSVKSNIGHLEPAAGISAVIKVVEALRNKKLPPTVNFNIKNHLINFEQSPFYVNDKVRDWRPECEHRRATVSSFGFGGTNAHVVLEEAPTTNLPVQSNRPTYHIAVVSAKSEKALERKLRDLGSFALNCSVRVGDICYSLCTARDHFNFRAALIVRNTDDFSNQLPQHKSNRLIRGEFKGHRKPDVAFVFSGADCSHSEFATSLYRSYKAFAKYYDECDRLLQTYLNMSLKSDWIYNKQEDCVSHDVLEAAQVFATEYAAAKMFEAWGVMPEYVVGFGPGYIAAACFAGAIQLADAIKIIIGMARKEALNEIKVIEPHISLLDPASGNSCSYHQLKTEHWDERLGNKETVKLERLNCFNGKKLQVIVLLGSAGSSSKLALESKINLIDTLKPGYIGQYSLLDALTRIYTAGVQIDWDAFYHGYQFNKVNLPLYPFQRKRFWVNKGAVNVEGINFIETEYVHRHLKNSPLSVSGQTWVLFRDSSGIANYLVKAINNSVDNIVVVKPGQLFTRVSGSFFSISPESEDDYFRLFKEVRDVYGEISVVVNMWAYNGYEDVLKQADRINERLNTGLFSVFNTFKALDELSSQRKINFITITSNARHFQTNSRFSPENSVVPVLMKIIPYEAKNIITKNIDFDPDELLAESIAKAIVTETGLENRDVDVIYRGGKRYVPEFVKSRTDRFPESEGLLSGDTIIVTGGAAGIGFVVSQFLAAKGLRLMLTGRSTLPPEDEWNELILACSNRDVVTRIKNIIFLRSKGYEIVYKQADVSNLTSMNEAAREAINRWGGIKGIIHCAGVIDSRNISLRSKTMSSFKNVLKPKVNGTLVLTDIIIKHNIPFAVFFSSLSSTAGFAGTGFGDYAAANAFMDGMSYYLSTKMQGTYISINWPVWEGIGMSNRGLVTREGYALSPEKALDAFAAIISRRIQGSIPVLDVNCENFIKRSTERPEPETAITELRADKPAPDNHPKYAAQVRKLHSVPEAVPPQEDSDLEDYLKTLLVKLLKIDAEEIDNDTSFGEYGMDSLVIADFMGGIEAYFGKHIEPSIIVQYQTIGDLAGYLTGFYGSRNIFSSSKQDDTVELVIKKAALQAAGSLESARREKDVNGLCREEILELLYNGEIDIERVMDLLEKDKL